MDFFSLHSHPISPVLILIPCVPHITILTPFIFIPFSHILIFIPCIPTFVTLFPKLRSPILNCGFHRWSQKTIFQRVQKHLQPIAETAMEMFYKENYYISNIFIKYQQTIKLTRLPNSLKNAQEGVAFQ